MTIALPGSSKPGSRPGSGTGDLMAATAKSLRFWGIAGLVLIGIFFGGLGAWAALAPLHSAAIAPGQVIVESNRKTVQHLEGGIIREILVEEGDQVAAGETLIELDQTKAMATLDLLKTRYHTALARAARLTAERKGADRITFPPELETAGTENLNVMEMMETQRGLFDERRASLEGQIDILERRIGQYREEIQGLRAQVTANERQATLIGEETDSVAKLVKDGLERRPRLLALQRHAAELEGNHGDLIARIAGAKQNIAESEARIIQLKNERREEVVGDLRQTRDELFELEERLRAQRDVVERTSIKAPKSGIIVDMQFHTAGGVIGPGEKILDIVPNQDRLMVEARVRPEDIDVVRAGLPAEIRFVAFKRRSTPTVEGTVMQVSADRLVDDRTGKSYFKARVQVTPESLEKAERLELAPGMPADVMIRTGERTALDYILSPITNTLERSLREQ